MCFLNSTGVNGGASPGRKWYLVTINLANLIVSVAAILCLMDLQLSLLFVTFEAHPLRLVLRAACTCILHGFGQSCRRILVRGARANLSPRG